MTYDQFRAELFRLYTQGNYSAAVELLQREGENYPEHAVRILYWQASVEGLANRPEDALRSLQKLVDCGWWYDAGLVSGDSDLECLHGRAEFDEIVRVFTERQEQARRAAKPEMLVLAPEKNTDGPHPLLIAIHGRNDSPLTFAPLWQPLVERGWLVALPQSSLILASDAYGWDDRERAINELVAHYQKLSGDYSIDPGRVILSGFSQGGGLSLLLTLSQQIPASGFIALAPYVHGIEEMEIQPAPAACRARGFIVTGDQDGGQAMFTTFEALLEKAGIVFQRRRYADLAHDIPADFPEVLSQALNFLQEN